MHIYALLCVPGGEATKDVGLTGVTYICEPLCECWEPKATFPDSSKTVTHQ